MLKSKSITYLSVLLPLIASSQVSVDTMLINNSDHWQIKNGITLSWKISKIKFGPYETIEIDKSQKKTVESKKEKSLEGSKGMLGIMKTTTTTQTKPYSLSVLHNSKDTINIDMILVTVFKNKRETIQFGKNEQADENGSIVFFNEASFKIDPNTSTWNMDNVSVLKNENLTDSFLLKNAKGFKIGGKVRKAEWLWAQDGYVFFLGDKQVAAIQTFPEINIWLKRDLSEDHRKVLGAAIISMITARSLGWRSNKKVIGL